MNVKRGEIYYANLDPVLGSEQGGQRPVLIIQNNKGNKHSTTTIVACITSKVYIKTKLPTHYYLPNIEGLNTNSLVMLEQIRTIDTSRLNKKIGVLLEYQMKAIDKRLCISLNLDRLHSLHKNHYYEIKGRRSKNYV